MTFLSFSERYGKELDDQRKFIGYLLAALYLRGIDRVEITREALEDEVWTGVHLKRQEVDDTSSFHFVWWVRGMSMPTPPAPKPVQEERDRYMEPGKAEYFTPNTPLATVFCGGMIFGAILVIIGVGMASWFR